MDKNLLKTEGLAFGRVLQRAYRLVLLYSADHAGAQDALQQAFSSLTALLKLSQQFTFGFYNQRVLLNDLLIPDDALFIMQSEFFKRNLAAVNFFFGITFRDFRRGMGLLATKPEVIEQGGGIDSFLRKNPVEGMRILAVGAAGPGMDLQSYMMAQAIIGTQQGRPMPGLEMLIQLAGIARPAAFGGTAPEVLDLVRTSLQAAWTDPKGDPRDVLHGLRRLLEDLSPDVLLSGLPAARQAQLRELSREEIATEMAEDMAIDWAANRLASATPGPEGMAVEGEVSRVLTQTGKTTREPQRLLEKFGRLPEQARLPQDVVERIQQELHWSLLTPEERWERLMAVEEFTDVEFRRLLAYIEEMRAGGNVEQAIQVSERYMSWHESRPEQGRDEATGRLPQFLRALSGLHQLALVRSVAERLCAKLLEESADWESHREVVQSLADAAQNAALLDDFETALKIGLDFERSLARDASLHGECCGAALKNLLAPASVERLIELSMEKNPDPASARTVAALLRVASFQTAEAVLRLLEEEASATARARLVRLAGQLGTSALEGARRRLADSRWYVVRNACNILGALDDSELAPRLEPALRHPDPRVQQAAVAALTKSKVSGRGEALAKALAFLQPHLQETVLDELILAKEPATVPHLADFILRKSTSRLGLLEKALQILIGIPDEQVVSALGSILCDTDQPVSLRRAAMASLKSSRFPSARQKLADFARLLPHDSLAMEYQRPAGPKAR